MKREPTHMPLIDQAFWNSDVFAEVGIGTADLMQNVPSLRRM